MILVKRSAGGGVMWWLVPAWLFGMTAGVGQASAETHQVPRSESEITIDGVVTEPAWEHALRLELRYEVQVRTRGQEVSEASFPTNAIPLGLRSPRVLKVDRSNLPLRRVEADPWHR